MTKRLDRLERERRRLIWDSTVLRTLAGMAPIATSTPQVKQDAPACTTTRHSGPTLTELLCDRLDRLERMTDRLDSEKLTMESRNRFWRWAGLASIALAVAICVIQAAGEVGRAAKATTPVHYPTLTLNHAHRDKLTEKLTLGTDSNESQFTQEGNRRSP